jgi:hypothetical protein
VPCNEAADRAAKKAAEYDPEVSESGVRTFTATAKSAICTIMKDESSAAREIAKHGREPFELGMQAAKAVLLIHDISGDQLGHHADVDRQDRPACVSLRHRQSRHRQMRLRARPANRATHPARMQERMEERH